MPLERQMSRPPRGGRGPTAAQAIDSVSGVVDVRSTTAGQPPAVSRRVFLAVDRSLAVHTLLVRGSLPVRVDRVPGSAEEYLFDCFVREELVGEPHVDGTGLVESGELVLVEFECEALEVVR